MNIDQKQTNMKKLDIKSIAIIVLGAALIISFLFGNKLHINDHKDEIKALHEQNSNLMLSNDSIKALNIKLDAEIKEINTKIVAYETSLATKDSEITTLKKKRNEVPRYVNSLSGDGVANAFSDYLNSSTKSNNHN